MRYAPKSLGVNDQAHALVQQRYAAEVLGYPVWGISSSATPVGDGYSEYGVRVLGSRGYEAGAVAPYAAALALSVTPEAAMANLRALADHYGIYGEYGFYDAVEPRSGTVAYKYWPSTRLCCSLRWPITWMAGVSRSVSRRIRSCKRSYR